MRGYDQTLALPMLTLQTMSEGDMTQERAPGAGVSRKRSRKISHLTQEQIEQKRIVDRRAQRAFRQRTKNCISNFERQFAQLKDTCDQKDKELGKVRRQNDGLLQCLETVLDLVSTALRENKATSPRIGDDFGEQCLGAQSDAHDEESTHLVEGAINPDLDLDSDPNLDPESNHASARTQDPQPAHSPAFNQAEAELIPKESCTVPAPCGQIQSNPQCTIVSQAAYEIGPNNSLPQSGNAYYNQTEHHAINNHESSSINANHPTEVSCRPCHDMPTPGSSTMGSTSCDTSNSPSKVLPSHLPSTCPLDQILLDFLTSQRDAISSGLPVLSVVGPLKPTVTAIMDVNRVDSVHPLSGIMSRVLSTFPFVRLPEKLAFFYLMAHTMRWQIHSTKENYTAMPSWIRPTVTQITTPHAMWIDNIPWPRVRDLLIENPEEYPFQVFSDYYSQYVTVNWKFSGLDAIANVENEAVLHSIFEKHIRNIKNWTVSSEFQSRFPSMTSAIYDHD